MKCPILSPSTSCIVTNRVFSGLLANGWGGPFPCLFPVSLECQFANHYQQIGEFNASLSHLVSLCTMQAAGPHPRVHINTSQFSPHLSALKHSLIIHEFACQLTTTSKAFLCSLHFFRELSVKAVLFSAVSSIPFS